jgi:hypothetical protein
MTWIKTIKMVVGCGLGTMDLQFHKGWQNYKDSIWEMDWTRWKKNTEILGENMEEEFSKWLME